MSCLFPPRLLEFVQSGAVFSLCWDIAAPTGRGGLPPRWVQRTLLGSVLEKYFVQAWVGAGTLQGITENNLISSGSHHTSHT